MVAHAGGRPGDPGQVDGPRPGDSVHIRLIAVGDRQPAWVAQAFDAYARRLPRQWRFRLEVIDTARRAGDAMKARTAEGQKVMQKLGATERVIALDEHGQQWSTTELAERLGEWQSAGRDLSLLIGGPDGIAEDCLARADSRWSLSKLTFPHGLARVVVAEQLYRASTLLAGHPYHRA